MIKKIVLSFFLALLAPVAYTSHDPGCDHGNVDPGDPGSGNNGGHHGNGGSDSCGHGAAAVAGSSCFNVGVYPIPLIGADYDRNRYLVYLGTAPYPKESEEEGVNPGPFNVVEFRDLHGTLALILSPLYLCGGGFIGVGLGINGGTRIESSRIATNLAEAKEMKRIRKFPRKAKDLLKHPNDTVIISKLSGGISVLLKGVIGFVNAIGPEYAVSGEWMVKVVKVSDYKVIVSLKTLKEKQWGFTNSLITSYVSVAKGNRAEKFYSFELSLATQEGMDLYDEIFKGRLYRLQRSASKDGKIVKILNKHPKSYSLYKDLVQTSGKKRIKTKVLNLGIPVLASYKNNFGSYEIGKEQFLFMNDQDESILGSVPKGTTMKRLVGMYHESQNTLGVLTKHKSRSKRFTVTRDFIRLPPKYRGVESFSDIPRQRLISEFVYTFKKNDWREGAWTEELIKLTKAIGYKPEIYSAMQDDKKNEELDFAGIEARLKLSEKSISSIRNWVQQVGVVNAAAYYKEKANKAVQAWFENSANSADELCGSDRNCQKKILTETDSALTKALGALGNVHGRIVVHDDTQKERFVLKNILKFGSFMTKNQFTMAVLIDHLKILRERADENDFAFCVRWKGSSFRQGQLVLFPSALRSDREVCYLKEETEIDQAPRIHDRELFGEKAVF